MIDAGGDHAVGWLRRSLPDTGPQRALVMSSFVNRIGTGMFLATSALYFTVIVGIPARQVGTGLSIAGLAALLGSVPAGTLADRVGPRTVQVVTLAVQTVKSKVSTAYHGGDWALGPTDPKVVKAESKSGDPVAVLRERAGRLLRR